MMGLEEHLITMFRDDFEFRDGAQPSHLGAAPAAAASAEPARAAHAAAAAPAAPSSEVIWLAEAETELKKVPFFVRGKARRNTEKFAREKGLSVVTVDTLYDAKAHYSR
jgi:light-independent protochlorophyllide reductase subunit B